MSKRFGLVLVGLGVGAGAVALIEPDLPLAPPVPADPVALSQPASQEIPRPTRQTAPAAPESEAVSAPPPSTPAPIPGVDLAALPQRIAVTRDTEEMKVPGGTSQLARDIQRHLKRVGCYSGDISGDWSVPTRRAMKSYLDDVNASLPVDQPQIVLLALLESQALPACGASCGPNALRAGDGRCRSTPAAVSRDMYAADLHGPTPPLDGRMSLAGPGATEKLEPDSASIAATSASEQPRSGSPKRARTPSKFGHPAWAFTNNPN